MGIHLVIREEKAFCRGNSESKGSEAWGGEGQGVLGGWPLSVLDTAGQEALGSPEGQAFPSLWITRIIC